MKKARRAFVKEFDDALEIFQDEFDKPATDKALKRALYFSFRDFKNNLIEKYYEVAKKEQEISDSVIEHVLSLVIRYFTNLKILELKLKGKLKLI